MLTKKLGFSEIACSQGIDFQVLQGLGDWYDAVPVGVGFDRGNQLFVTACDLLNQANVGGQCLKINVGIDSSGLFMKGLLQTASVVPHSRRNRPKILFSNLETLLSKSLNGRLPQNVMDPVEKIAPPEGVSK